MKIITDFEKKTIRINKSYQRIDKEDVITSPKTEKSNRVITVPQFLLDDIQSYLDNLYHPKKENRLFRFSKNYLERELVRGAKKAGLEKIRLHDLRPSHAALLIEMGTPILAVSNRLGHEKVSTTLDIYGHLYPNKQQMIADKMDEMFGGVSNE